MHRLHVHTLAARMLMLTLAAALLAAPAALAAAAAPPPGTATATTFNGTPTVGPLFVSAASTHHFCTASVVHSPRGDVLLTAAHCVAGTGVGYTFAPGFHAGVAPYGRWTVTGAYLDPAWLTSQDPRRDFAFLTVAPKLRDGRPTEIERVTGANILGLHTRRGERVTIPAYPGGADNLPVTCEVPLYYEGVYPAFNCDPYVGGTSGSPWLVRSGSGHKVVALIGGLHQGGCFSYTSYSPPFGDPVRRAYLRAVHHDVPDVAPVAGSDGC
jgi:V8-like Glu-specific endopeptidase